MGFRRLHRCLPCLGLGVLLLVQLLGCNNDNDSAGPCEHIYQEPILEITEVRDGSTEDALDSVILRDFTIGGVTVPVSALTEQFANNVEVRGDSLLCTPPCGFGTQEGHYEFTAAAAGYLDQVLSLDVQYGEFEGGCPSYNRGGLAIDIELDPR